MHSCFIYWFELNIPLLKYIGAAFWAEGENCFGTLYTQISLLAYSFLTKDKLLNRMRIKISDTLLVRGVLIFNFTLLQMHSNWKFFSEFESRRSSLKW